MKNAPTLESESRLIVDDIPGNVALLSAAGDVEVVNGQLLEYFGQTVEELKQWGTNGTVHPEDLSSVIEVFGASIAAGTPYQIVQRLRRADGVYRWMENKGFPLRDQNGHIHRWCVLLTDIDGQKRAEESLHQREQDLKLIVETIPTLVWGSLPDGSADFFNQHYLDYMGLTSEQAMGWGWVAAIHPDDLEEVLARWQDIRSSEQQGDTEGRLRRHDGVYRWFLFRANPFRDEQGKIVKWYGANTDIEDRKLAQEALAANERDLRSIINTIPTHIYVLNTDGSVQHVNQAVMDYTGLTIENVQQEDYRDRVIHPEDFKRIRAERAASLRIPAPFSTEQRVLGIDGQYRWFLVRYKPLLDTQGRIVRWYVAAFDIEDRKRAEAQVEQAYLRLAEAQRLSRTGSFITDLTADDHNWSDEAYRIFEFDSGTKVTVQRIREIIHPDDLPLFDSVIERGMSGGDVNFEFRIVTARGEIKHLQGVAHVTEQMGGRPIFVGALRDVTKSKVAEDALRESERQFKTVFDEAGVGISLVDLRVGEPIRNNRALQKMLGRSEEKLALFETYDELTHPDNRQKDSATFRELYNGKRDSLKIEKHFVLDDGRSIWANVIFTLLRDDDGQPRYIIAIHEDITERKQSEETLRTIVETNPECVKLIDRDGTLLRVNAAGVAMSGAPSEEVILGHCFYEFIAPEDRDRYREFNEVICAGHKGFLEYDIITMQGERRHMETHAAPMRHNDGSLVQLGVTRDITDRKRTFEELKANQDLLDLAQKSAGAMAFDWYIQQEINQWSPEQEGLFGLPPGGFDGTYQSWKKMIYPPDWPTVVEAIQHAHQTGIVEAEFRVVWPDGSLHWLSTNGRMFFDEEGMPLRMVGFTSDVTRRKTAEVQLAGEKRLLEMVATGRALPDILASFCTFVEDTAPGCHCGIYLIDWAGPKVEVAIGPTLPVDYNAAMDGLYFTSETGPCAKAACERTQVIAADVETDEQWQSSPFRTFSLANGLKSCWSTPIYSRSGEVLGTFAIYHTKPAVPTSLQQDLIAQVTHIASIAIERAQREEALRRSEGELRRTNEYLTIAQQLSRTGSYTRDVLTDEQILSDEMYRIWDFDTAKPVTHEMVLERIHPDDLSLFQQTWVEAAESGENFALAYRIVTGEGTVKHVRTVSRRLAEITDRIVYVGATQDVTEKKLAEEALRRSEAFLAEGQHLARTGNLSWRVATDEITWSDEMYRIFEFEPGSTVTLERIAGRVHPDDLAMLYDMLDRAKSGADDFGYEHRIVMPNRSTKYLNLVAHRSGDDRHGPEYIGAVQDVTQRRLAEEALSEARSELARAARAMSLGVLTASIAHEVNQPLSGIITNSSTCVRMLDADPPNIDGARETARRTIRDGNRASEVIKRLRALFSRKEFTVESLDLNELTLEVIALSRNELQKGQVVLQTELANDLPQIDGDRVQIQQVILNLLLNAADAMNGIDDRSRLLTIKTQLNGGRQILLSVRDVGVGFGYAEAEKLFDAFYTTKKTGMGIGLSVSRSIIESHQGRLWAAPNEGPGAIFSFSIPILYESEPHSPAAQ